MKFFRTICRMMICLAAVVLVLSSARAEDEIWAVGDTGLDLTETISIHYPALSGSGDADLLKQVNSLIQEKCRIGDYLTRAAQLLSGGNLKVEWKGGAGGGVLSVAVSAFGAVQNTRTTHVWTGVSVDLRNGREIAFSDLFTNEEAARGRLENYLEETVAPDLSAHLQNSALTPLPELFYLEQSGLTLLYPVGQLSTLSDRAGEIRVGWHVLRDVLDLAEDSILSRIGVRDMICLSAESGGKLRETAAEGFFSGIPAKIGDSMRELTDRYHMLNDPDGFEGGRLFSLEEGSFRGVYLMTDDLTRDWDSSRVEGIRMDQGCLWGLCVGETRREDWRAVLGDPDGSAEISGEKAEANRLDAGSCDYYRCGEYILQLYSDDTGLLTGIILTE